MAEKSLSLVAASSQFAGIAAASWTGLGFTSSFTLAIWVQPASLTGDMVLLGTCNRSGAGGGYFIRNIAGTPTTLDAKYTNAGTDVATQATDQLSNGVWTHVAFTHDDAADTDVLYVNGTAVTTNTLRTNNPSAETVPFRVGARSDVASDYWDGLLDDARVWSRALSSTEINALANAPCSFNNGASLQGWWNFSDDYTDNSGNGNTLTSLGGSPTFSTTVPYVCTAPFSAGKFIWQAVPRAANY